MITVLSLMPLPVSAEEWRDGSVLLSCMPDKGIFELETRESFYDLVAELNSPGVYFPASLEASPFVCQLTSHEIKVEGRNNNDGKGPCGAREGGLVRVSIDGVPVRHEFETKKRYSSVHELKSGWIETSRCFERQHSVTVRVGPAGPHEWMRVELCRIEDSEDLSAAGTLALSGACKIWSSHSDPFPTMSDTRETAAPRND